MYARIARFTLGSENVDAAVAAAERNFAAVQAGGDSIEARVARHASRALMLVDRESGEAVSLFLCPTREDMEEADRLLDSMSPPDEYSGRRTQVQKLEVVLDQDLGG